MTASINASTSSGVALTSDTSGALALQSNGTTQFTVDSTGAYGQVERGSAVGSGGTSIIFSSLPTWIKRITVMFNGVSTSGTSNLQIQLGAGSVTITGYLSAAANILAGTPVTANSTTGLIVTGATASTALWYGNITLTNITGNVWTMSSSLGRSDVATVSTAGGSISLGDTLDRTVITTVNGTDTFDAGSFNILYEG
jgi:hypothetical protein